MQREPVHYATTKLSGEWSAANFSGNLKELVMVLVEKFEKLDPTVRVRLLLSTLFLRPAAVREIRSDLQQLCAVAADDEDEWVRIVGRAVAKLNGFLDFENVKEHSKEVNDSVNQLTRLLRQKGRGGFEPLELAYLNPQLVPQEVVHAATAKHAHFKRREGAGDVAKELAHPAAGAEMERYPSIAPDKAATTPGQKYSSNFRKSSGADMFLSSRPTTTYKPMGTFGGAAQYPEKKGLARTSKIKQIDVAEVKVLNRQPSRIDKSESKTAREAELRALDPYAAPPPSRPDTAGGFDGDMDVDNGRGHQEDIAMEPTYERITAEEDDLEAGEIEAGELPEDVNAKRPRLQN